MSNQTAQSFIIMAWVAVVGVLSNAWNLVKAALGGAIALAKTAASRAWRATKRVAGYAWYGFKVVTGAAVVAATMTLGVAGAVLVGGGLAAMAATTLSIAGTITVAVFATATVGKMFDELFGYVGERLEARKAEKLAKSEDPTVKYRDFGPEGYTATA